MESHLSVLEGGLSTRSHHTLAEKAFDTLHTAIIAGRLRPGARLPIEELAERLQMSPMPIREAVRRLHASGLVENIPHRGARVTELSITDMTEVHEARLALELLAIRRAAERFSRADEARARTSLTLLVKRTAENSDATTDAHAAFHFSLYDVAGSAWLRRLIRPAWETSERYSLEFPQCYPFVERIDEHQELLDACAARDPDRATIALHDHLARTANKLSQAMGGEALFELS
jgi:DNA-binding GntR family transcriptional regulator